MVLHKYVDGVDTIFATMVVPLVNNMLETWLGVIRRGTYQAASEDSRWAYEPVSDLCPYIEPAGDSSNHGSSDEGIKYYENQDYQGHYKVVFFPCSNPRRLRWGDQRALIQLKSGI